MTYRPHPKYADNSATQGPWTTCDRCGFVWSQRDMAWQYDFLGGSTPQKIGFLFCPRCLDGLQWQRKLLVIPPDPPPIYNVRPEAYAVDETNFLLTEDGEALVTESAEIITTNQPNPAASASTARLSSTILYPSGSLSTCYLDFYVGNPASGGYSVLAKITGSTTRTDVASSLTTVLGIAKNPDTITVTTASENTVNVTHVAIFSAATSGTLLASGAASVYGPTVTSGNAVVFDPIALVININ